jgi:mgtE-like transporter
MLRRLRRLPARFGALWRSDAPGIRAGFGALLISSGGDLLAGLALAGLSNTLTTLPGLIILIPAAIGMRGNVMGGLGSRLGTMIHAGTFRSSRRLNSEVGQNLIASIVLSLATSVALAFLARTVTIAIGGPSISVADFMVISVIGAILSSFVVMFLTVAVAGLCARKRWDLDNVAAPIVTAAGDTVTLPSLWIATFLVGYHLVTPVIAIACALLGVACLVIALISKLPVLRRIVIESFPILVVAGSIDIIAGALLQKRESDLLVFPALLVMLPAFLEDSGSLGAILGARVSTKLHLGLLQDPKRPFASAGEDFLLTFVYAIPVFVLLGVSASLAADATGKLSPGMPKMIAVSMLGGFLATIGAATVGYLGAVVTHRFGLDPDNHSIPIVTSTLDLLGAFSFILSVVLLGLAHPATHHAAHHAALAATHALHWVH